MADNEIDYAKEYHGLWQAYVELGKKIPNDENVQRQAMRAQMNYVLSLALPID